MLKAFADLFLVGHHGLLKRLGTLGETPRQADDFAVVLDTEEERAAGSLSAYSWMSPLRRSMVWPLSEPVRRHHRAQQDTTKHN